MSSRRFPSSTKKGVTPSRKQTFLLKRPELKFERGRNGLLCHSHAKAMAMPRKSKLLSHLQPSPSKFKLLERERWFILDCVAVDTIAKDYSCAFPKLGSVIPLYDAQQDPHAAAYFMSKPVLLLFQQIGQVNRRPLSYEKLVQRFRHRGDAALYLRNRNKAGAGHSTEQVRGHQLFLSSDKPVLGYNGAYGYRRNTPSLRRRPSPFGRVTNLPLH